MENRRKELPCLKIFFVIEGFNLVIIEWLLNGERSREVVSLREAKRRRLQLEAFGAVVYWSERI